MIEKVLANFINVVKNNTKDVGQKFVRKVGHAVNNDFLRSPKNDCFKATNPIKASQALASNEQEPVDNFIKMIQDENFPRLDIKFFQKASKQKNPDGSLRFDVPTFWQLVEMKNAQFKRFIKLADAQNPDGQFKFNRDELIELSKVKELNLDKIDLKKLEVLKLAKKSLDNKLFFENEGAEAALLPGGMDLEKLLPSLKEKLTLEKNKLVSITIGRPEESLGEFTVRYGFKNENTEELLFNNAGKELNHSMTKFISHKNGEKECLQKIYDAKNNSYSITRGIVKDEEFLVKKEIKTIKNKAGNIISKEILTPSEVEGIYNVKSIDAKGNIKILSSGVKDEKGCVTVKKDLESLDGTKTHYEYYDDPAGNRLVDMKIIDKNGYVLLNDKQVFEVVDKNTAISSHGPKSYEIKTNEVGMKIRNLQTNETTQINFDKLLVSDSSELKELLTKVNAEEIIALNKKGAKLNHIEDIAESKVSSNGVVDIVEDMFGLEHETGHVKDARSFNNDEYSKNGLIVSDKKLLKIYNDERKAFMIAFPSVQQKQIDYFINKINHYGGPKGGLKETIAESNGLLNTHPSMAATAMRTHTFQQYFPRTIAKAAELLGAN